MTPADRPLPSIDDPVAGPFWQATNQSRLSVQRCAHCGYLRWPPAAICPECMTVGGEWTNVSGTGKLWSFAVYHRALHPGFSDLVPYAVGMVHLDAGPRMVGMMTGPVGDLRIDQRVEVVFERLTADVTLVRWRAFPEGVPSD